jgi:adenosine deaminase
MTLPLAELHLHVEGTLEADLLVELARRNDVPLPSYDPAELTARYADFADLQAFLDVYYANLAVLRTAQDFADLAEAYLRRARAAGVVGLLFGAGAEGCTTPATDGGHFHRLARRAASR